MSSGAGWCDRRRVKRALASVATVVLAAGSVVQLSSTDTAAAGDGYTTYVACSTRASAKPATQCRMSQPKAAFFMSRKHDATYKVCVKFPGKKKRLCASAQDAPQGRKKFVTIATANVGTHKVRWYVGGRQVGAWNFEVIEG